MDYSFLPPGGPLSAVQLIPVINYLNILSEFLFLENYLPEVNQHKQIPIVNALYEYLDDNRGNTANKVKLIRDLLKGSDLYGEHYSEEFNVYFVHRMFDYIISSLVFNKYGNIYGFLANIVRSSKNLQTDYVMKEIKEKLKEEKFENEYGIYSKLTDLAVRETFQNLIQPLFPESNLNLLSFDYIFAQAGLNYIQFGNTNKTLYFPNFDMSVNRNFSGSFTECLALGHLIKILLDRESIDSLNYRVFALPALFYYVTTEVDLVTKRIEEIIFEPKHWKAAYEKFLPYLQTNLDKIDELLMKDYNYKIHVAFSNFQSIVTMTRYVINLEYRHLKKMSGGENFSQPLVAHSNINNWFQDQIHNFGEIYGRYELESSKESFKKFLPEDLDDVVITLLYSNNPVLHGDLSRMINSREINESNCFNSYDLFEFYFTGNETYEYYALVRENYTVLMVKLTEDDNFQGKVNISLSEIIKSGHRVILKYANETNNDLAKEFMNFKKKRFTSYLHYSEEEMKNNKWWKEFGLSLVPKYPCLQNKICEKNNLKFLNQFKDDISLYLTNKNTKTLLDSLGMKVKTIFLKDAISDVVYTSALSEKKAVSNNTLYDRFALNLEEPSFVDEATKMSDIVLIKKYFYDFSETMDEKIEFLEILDKMLILKTVKNKKIDRLDLYVKTGLNNEGYGYKYSTKFSYDGKSSKFNYGVLRKEYNFKKSVFVIPSKIYKNTFILLDNKTLEFDGNRFFFNIDHQLRGKSTKVVFSGVCSNHSDVIDDKRGNNCYDDDRINYCQGQNFGKDDKIKIYPNRNEMFEKLLYQIQLDRRSITFFEGEERIDSIYTHRERLNIEGETKLESMIDNYNEQLAYNLVIFEEYYAIRNFISGGEERIQQDSLEAKQMKIALYRLAIRQYEEKKEEFSGRLFRFETKTVDYVKKELYVGKQFSLQKFTTTSTNFDSAARFMGYSANEYRIILYYFKFDGPYFRSIVEVKVDQFEPIFEKKIILLPGTSFTISHISIVTRGGIGNFMKVDLTLNTDNAKKN